MNTTCDLEKSYQSKHLFSEAPVLFIMVLLKTRNCLLQHIMKIAIKMVLAGAVFKLTTSIQLKLWLLVPHQIQYIGLMGLFLK
jgi:hypothetical protein